MVVKVLRPVLCKEKMEENAERNRASLVLYHPQPQHPAIQRCHSQREERYLVRLSLAVQLGNFQHSRQTLFSRWLASVQFVATLVCGQS